MDTRRLDLNLLVALEALLAERNVTRAASRLHISQPALSAQLARLRRIFDDQLLLPAQRGMVPTARALELQEPLRRALEEVRRVTVTGGAFDPAGASLTLTIAASDYVQVAVLLDFTLRLRGAAPNIRIGIHNRSERLAVFEPPIKVPGFAISLLWHDRTHDHPAHVWVRSKIAQWI